MWFNSSRTPGASWQWLWESHLWPRLHRHHRVCLVAGVSSVDDVHPPLKFPKFEGFYLAESPSIVHCSFHLNVWHFLSIPNAHVIGASVPAVFLDGWLLSPFPHLHQEILGCSFSNVRSQTQWRQRREPRVWSSNSSSVSCHQAADQRTLQEGTTTD